jgi:malonate decarboxylase acyl carrier protein
VALQELHFEFKIDNPLELGKAWIHCGVVSSGDMEVLMEKKDLEGGAKIKVVTPVKGFERVWALILERFIRQSRLGNVFIEINDNYATPLVASMRLRQALADAKEQKT